MPLKGTIFILQADEATQAQWEDANPILRLGRYYYDTTNNQVKIGDGIHHWNELPYAFRGPPGAPAAVTGSVLMWPLNEAPDGYLVCDGSLVARADFAALYDVIGDHWGPGSGGTHFNLPDFRGRMPIGAPDFDSTPPIAGSGGEFDHTHDVSVTDGPSANLQIDTPGFSLDGPYVATGDHTHASATPTSAANPPYLGINFIIKT